MCVCVCVYIYIYLNSLSFRSALSSKANSTDSSIVSILYPVAHVLQLMILHYRSFFFLFSSAGDWTQSLVMWMNTLLTELHLQLLVIWDRVLLHNLDGSWAHMWPRLALNSLSACLSLLRVSYECVPTHLVTDHSVLGLGGGSTGIWTWSLTC
jgi:hypothetical protein